MARKMLINATHLEENRVAIVENGILEEFDIETTAREQIKGNIYKGIVVKVEPSLQAAFVDYGANKAGFLSFFEIQPACYGPVVENKRSRPRIQEVIKRGQELLVQIIKEERDGKGAALTTYISLPGSYLVLMPDSDNSGVSRKIEDEDERKNLKELIKQLPLPEGMGCIVRTAGLGRSKNDLAKDLNYLLRLWNKIQADSHELTAPSLVYQESNLVIRTIRDYFTSDIREVLIDNKEVYNEARNFFKVVMPRYYRIVRWYREKTPLFSKYQLEEQIETIYERKVPLKSGGSIVIDRTEALVSIDVNSGRSTKGKSIEDTAFKTNLEAAEEIARHLRLRDLGGLIIVDFIDMKDSKNNREVEKCFHYAIRKDKAKIQFSRISTFGIMELSRQRLKASLLEGCHLICQQCHGTGIIKSIKFFALSVLRKMQSTANREELTAIKAFLPLEASSYLLNDKRETLLSLEKEYNIKIAIEPKPQLFNNQYQLEFQRKETSVSPEMAAEKIWPIDVASEISRERSPFPVPYLESPGKIPPYVRTETDFSRIASANPVPNEEVGGEVLVKQTEDLSETTPDNQEFPPEFGIQEWIMGNQGTTGIATEEMSSQGKMPESDRRLGSENLQDEELSEMLTHDYGRTVSPLSILETLGEHYLEFIIESPDKCSDEKALSAPPEQAAPSCHSFDKDKLDIEKTGITEERLPGENLSGEKIDQEKAAESVDLPTPEPSTTDTPVPPPRGRKRRYFYRYRTRRSKSSQ